MNKGYTAGMEADTAIGVGAVCTVFEVTLDGTTDSCQLATYLVVTAGEEIHFE